MAGVAGGTAVRTTVLRSRRRFWTAKDFPDVRPEIADRALSRLADSRELRRVRKGLYWRGVKTALGMPLPRPDVLAEKIAPVSRGMGPAGLTAAGFLGLTTQLPRVPSYAVPARAPRPDSVPSTVHLVSRAACRGRIDAGLSAAEVALLEVLRNWNGFVEADDTLAEHTIGSMFERGEMRASSLCKALPTEPPVVSRELMGRFGSYLGGSNNPVRGTVSA